MTGVTTLLASAARTTALQGTGPDQGNTRSRGVYLFLDVTANPGGAETLTVAIQIKDKVSGKYRTITAFTAAAAATNATYIYALYPSVTETAATANLEVQSLPLPALWRAVVTPSASGSWTYSLAAQTVP